MNKDNMDEQKKLIQELKKKEYSINRVAKILNMSWDKVKKNWEQNTMNSNRREIGIQKKDEEMASAKEKDEEKETDIVTREDLRYMYQRYDEGALPADIIKEKGIKQASQVYEQFCKDKKYMDPKLTYENTASMFEDFYKMMEDVEVFKKDMKEMKGNLDTIWSTLKLLMENMIEVNSIIYKH